LRIAAATGVQLKAKPVTVRVSGFPRSIGTVRVLRASNIWGSHDCRRRRPMLGGACSMLAQGVADRAAAKVGGPAR